MIKNYDSKGTAKKPSPGKKSHFIVCDLYGDYVLDAVMDTRDNVVYPMDMKRYNEYIVLAKTDEYFTEMLAVYDAYLQAENKTRA